MSGQGDCRYWARTEPIPMSVNANANSFATSPVILDFIIGCLPGCLSKLLTVECFFFKTGFGDLFV